MVSFNGELEMLEQFRDHIFTLSMHERHLFREMIEEGKQVYDKPFGKNLVYRKDAPHEPEHLPGAKQMIRNLLEQLLISLYRKQQECPAQVQSLPMQSLGMEYQIVRQVVTFLDQNIYNNITFVDVASHFNLSETQLKKLFREVTGYSVMQYYRKSVVGVSSITSVKWTKISPNWRICSTSAPSTIFPSFTGETGHTLREYLKSSQDVSLP
ncbi:MAG: AraC family transcriptional regulator [Ruthenibacterium lactatiformans]